MTSQKLAATLAIVVAISIAGCQVEDTVPRRPQIVPHINPVNICEIEMPAPNTTCVIGDPTQACELGQCSCATDPCLCIPRRVSFDLMLYNQGRERLDITGFEVKHDSRCAFEPPGGGVKLYDNDATDQFAATARNREAAFMRIEYSPPPEEPGVDGVIINIHSNAENFPEPEGLDIFVCAAGTFETTINCRIRLDEDNCRDGEANTFTCDPTEDVTDNMNPCPSYCSESGVECTPPTPDDPMADDCPEGEFCRSPYYCVPDEDDRSRGTCFCRPCAAQPDAADCPTSSY